MADPVLKTPERNKLRDMITTLSDFTDYGIRGRREFAAAAGLGNFVSGITWDGSDRIVAGDLVDKLNKYGFLREPPTYHALGALVVYMIDHPDTSPSAEKFLATLVVEHGLVADYVFLQNLREKYALEAKAPAAVQPALTADHIAQMAEEVQQPPFVPKVADQDGLERARNSEDNFLDILQLLGAIYSAEAVGIVELPDRALGTGWLIGPKLLLTNHHVLPTAAYVAEAAVRFGFRKDALNVKVADGTPFKFDPSIYYTSDEQGLDYALVGLAEEPLAEMKIDDDAHELSLLELIRRRRHRGYLVPAPRNILNLQRVNIIQHPGGQAQKAVLTQNYVTADMSATRVHYTADTDEGSSGSPVFNALWEVVALHHSGKPVPPIPGVADVNEGIPMKAILKDFEELRTSSGQRLISLLPQVK